MKCIRKAAEQGHPEAQAFLGEFFATGKGVTQDYREATKWYRKAAEQGYLRAQIALGKLYTEGQGVIQDFVQADAWFNLAASQGFEKARQYRDMVSKLMNPNKIAEAQALAREWAEKYNK